MYISSVVCLFLIFQCGRETLKKIYCVDPGVVYSYSLKPQFEKGSSLENAVYLVLCSSGQENIFYHKTKSGKEIDFVAQKESGEIRLVQVCLDMSDEETRKRETSALVEAMQELEGSQAYIVTFESEETIEIGEQSIQVLPFWKWATSSE